MPKINRNDLLNAGEVDSSSSSSFSFDYLVLYSTPSMPPWDLGVSPHGLHVDGKTTRIHAVRRVGRVYCTVCRVVWPYHSLPTVQLRSAV